jgi:cyanate permease
LGSQRGTKEFPSHVIVWLYGGVVGWLLEIAWNQKTGRPGLAIGVGTLIGPTLVGSIYDLTGGYGTAFLTSACLVLVSIPCMLASYWYAAGQREVREVSKVDFAQV